MSGRHCSQPLPVSVEIATRHVTPSRSRALSDLRWLSILSWSRPSRFKLVFPAFNEQNLAESSTGQNTVLVQTRCALAPQTALNMLTSLIA